ncbi:MAG: hypothetical protein ABW277_05755 [Longimicrobiaceae bacterium]
MISTLVSRASAVLLLAGGLALLFAPDVVLPRLVPGFPAGGEWLGQLLAAALLGLAALDWLSRASLLGGIYGRPVVLANTAFYFVAAMALLRHAVGRDVPAALWVVAVPVALLAGVYGWLLLRGPAERDLQAYRRSRSGSREDVRGLMREDESRD